MSEVIRTQFRSYLHDPRRRPRRCEQDDCNSATQGGKPFCTEHVTEHPYVQEVMASLARRELEETRVAKVGSRAVDVTGITSQEILGYLAVHGPSTSRRLAHELNINTLVLDGYLKAQKRRKLVKFTTNRRGRLVVHPLEQPLEVVEVGARTSQAA